MTKTIKCPYCGAVFEVPETVSIAVCPYCGTAVWQATGEVFNEHYMFEVRYEYNRAFDAARMVAHRQFAAPDDLYESAQPKGGFLHFIPLYLYHISVRAECPDNPEAGLEEDYAAVLAIKKPLEGMPESYRFPVRGRRFFEPARIERGRYYQPELDPKQLIPKVSESAKKRALREALDACRDPKLVDETKWLGIVHYPVWEIKYAYRGKEYRALVDGSDGSVIYLEYPIGGKERGTLLAMGFGGILASIVLGGIVSAVAAGSPAGAAGGLLAGLGLLYPTLRLGAARKGIYKRR